jgi:hypothetical protein
LILNEKIYFNCAKKDKKTSIPSLKRLHFFGPKDTDNFTITENIFYCRLDYSKILMLFNFLGNIRKEKKYIL